MPKTSNNKKIYCEFCGKEIPEERLEILPDATTCVECSQTQPYSEAEVIGLNGNEEENRLNLEDYEDSNGDLSLTLDDGW
ncbi:TraR/DksA C4-type zinc finger protein [bacterium]|nr:TraR/DksA C4-type zinc finger protein [bacterium]